MPVPEAAPGRLLFLIRLCWISAGEGPSSEADADDVVLNDVVLDRRAADKRIQPDAVAREGRDGAALDGETVDDHVAGADARPLNVVHNRFRREASPCIDAGLSTQESEGFVDR